MNDIKTQKKWARIHLSSGKTTAELERISNNAEANGNTISAEIIRKACGSQKKPAASISVLGKIVRTTEKAILFDSQVGDYIGEAWFPKSMTSTFAGDQYGLTRLTAPVSMIREKLTKNE